MLRYVQGEVGRRDRWEWVCGRRNICKPVREEEMMVRIENRWERRRVVVGWGKGRQIIEVEKEVA